MAEGLFAVATKALPRAFASASWLGIRMPSPRTLAVGTMTNAGMRKTAVFVFTAVLAYKQTANHLKWPARCIVCPSGWQTLPFWACRTRENGVGIRKALRNQNGRAPWG